MRNRGWAPPGEKRITPDLLQVPPRVIDVSLRTCGVPPEISMRFSFPSAKNPKDWPSGDQNGFNAPSVPASGRKAVELIERTHRRDRPSDSAENTTCCPSGEMANETKSEVAGVVMSSRTSVGIGEGLVIVTIR